MAARFVDIGARLLSEGLFIKDGESWGWSAEDVTRARYLDRGSVIPGPVVSFNIEKIDPAF